MNIQKISNTNFGAMYCMDGISRKDRNFINTKVKPALDSNMVDFLDYLGYDLRLSVGVNPRKKDVLVIQKIDRTGSERTQTTNILLDNLQQGLQRFNSRQNKKYDA